MAIWLNRAGSHGEYEQKFIQENRIYATWDDLSLDLSKLEERSQLVDALRELNPDCKRKTAINWASQIWPFVHEMKKGDLVILPLKSQPAIQIGEITGNYKFEITGPSPYFHWRQVKWIGEAIPRTHFGQDLLHTFGAFMTICRVQRNNAELRINAMKSSSWKAETRASASGALLENVEQYASDTEEVTNLEELANDYIAGLIETRFKGHGLTRLVEAILKAQGYITYRSAEGADGGADILAGTGPLGFGKPRLCIEVKSESAAIDRPTVDKLLGAVSKFSAEEGLFVSWSGFKPNVQKELAASFFRVRLWSRKELLEALFENYESMDEEIRAELPLKRVWMVASQEEE